MEGRASDLTGTRINTAADTNNKSTADSEIIYIQFRRACREKACVKSERMAVTAVYHGHCDPRRVESTIKVAQQVLIIKPTESTATKMASLIPTGHLV